MSWIPRKSLRYRWQSEIDGVVLYDVELSKAFRLNKTAGKIWGLCDGLLSDDEVVLKLAAEYREEDRLQAQTEARRFLEHMKEQGMLVG